MSATNTTVAALGGGDGTVALSKVGVSLFITSSAMAAATVFFLWNAALVPFEWCMILVMLGSTTGISFLAYEDLKDQWQERREIPIVHRYVEWFITVPLQLSVFYMLLDIAIPYNKPERATIALLFRLIFAALAMLLFGFAGETGVMTFWPSFLIGCGCWLFILYEVFYGEAAKLAALMSVDEARRFLQEIEDEEAERKRLLAVFDDGSDGDSDEDELRNKETFEAWLSKDLNPIKVEDSHSFMTKTMTTSAAIVEAKTYDPAGEVSIGEDHGHGGPRRRRTLSKRQQERRAARLNLARKQKYALDDREFVKPIAERAFNWLRTILLCGWTLYPISYAVHKQGGEDDDMERQQNANLIYNFGDLLNKIGFGIVAYWCASSDEQQAKTLMNRAVAIEEKALETYLEQLRRAGLVHRKYRGTLKEWLGLGAEDHEDTATVTTDIADERLKRQVEKKKEQEKEAQAKRLSVTFSPPPQRNRPLGMPRFFPNLFNSRGIVHLGRRSGAGTQDEGSNNYTQKNLDHDFHENYSSGLNFYVHEDYMQGPTSTILPAEYVLEDNVDNNYLFSDNNINLYQQSSHKNYSIQSVLQASLPAAGGGDQSFGDNVLSPVGPRGVSTSPGGSNKLNTSSVAGILGSSSPARFRMDPTLLSLPASEMRTSRSPFKSQKLFRSASPAKVLNFDPSAGTTSTSNHNYNSPSGYHQQRHEPQSLHQTPYGNNYNSYKNKEDAWTKNHRQLEDGTFSRINDYDDNNSTWWWSSWWGSSTPTTSTAQGAHPGTTKKNDSSSWSSWWWPNINYWDHPNSKAPPPKNTTSTWTTSSNDDKMKDQSHNKKDQAQSYDDSNKIKDQSQFYENDSNKKDNYINENSSSYNDNINTASSELDKNNIHFSGAASTAWNQASWNNKSTSWGASTNFYSSGNYDEYDVENYGGRKYEKNSAACNSGSSSWWKSARGPQQQESQGEVGQEFSGEQYTSATDGYNYSNNYRRQAGAATTRGAHNDTTNHDWEHDEQTGYYPKYDSYSNKNNRSSSAEVVGRGGRRPQSASAAGRNKAKSMVNTSPQNSTQSLYYRHDFSGDENNYAKDGWGSWDKRPGTQKNDANHNDLRSGTSYHDAQQMMTSSHSHYEDNNPTKNHLESRSAQNNGDRAEMLTNNAQSRSDSPTGGGRGGGGLFSITSENNSQNYRHGTGGGDSYKSQFDISPLATQENPFGSNASREGGGCVVRATSSSPETRGPQQFSFGAYNNNASILGTAQFGTASWADNAGGNGYRFQ